MFHFCQGSTCSSQMWTVLGLAGLTGEQKSVRRRSDKAVTKLQLLNIYICLFLIKRNIYSVVEQNQIVKKSSCCPTLAPSLSTHKRQAVTSHHVLSLCSICSSAGCSFQVHILIPLTFWCVIMRFLALWSVI